MVAAAPTYVPPETESTILTIQDQFIATRVYGATMMSRSIPSLMCRLCGVHEETIVLFISLVQAMSDK